MFILNLSPESALLYAAEIRQRFEQAPFRVGDQDCDSLAAFADGALTAAEQAARELRPCHTTVTIVDSEDERIVETDVQALLNQMHHVHTAEAGVFNPLLEAIEAAGIVATLARQPGREVPGYTGTYVSVVHAWKYHQAKHGLPYTFVQRRHVGCDALGRSLSVYHDTGRIA